MLTMVALGACRAATPPAVTLPALALDATPPAGRGAAITAGLARAPIANIQLTPVALPPPPTEVTPPRDDQPSLAAARAAYLDVDPDGCLRQLADVDVPALLARGDRDTAARVLVLRFACEFDDQPTAARITATQLATFGLALPPEVSVTKPPAEALLDEVRRAVGAQPLTALAVTSTPAAAALALDGLPVDCQTPCTLRVRPGVHVLTATLDGHDPATAVVDASTDVARALPLTPAAPEAIAAQLRARLRRGGAGDDPVTLALAAAAVRAPRVLVVVPSEVGGAVRLIGALVDRGAVLARAETRTPVATLGDASARLARELLLQARVIAPAPPVWRRWPFWAAVGGAALAAGAISFALLYEPDPSTSVVIGGLTGGAP